ncbi:MAG: MaoC family dehydratase N-terminal domain-containing protein, partial [Chloroflexota bacterium]|nr:MaoC family dehydratase N-terminal domain-containing protein [Chloroflexota bacterium]
GDDWEFYRPILVNDQLTYTNAITELVEKQSKMAGKTLIQYHEVIYYNQRGEMVAKTRDWCVRAGRADSQEKGKYRDISRATYTPEQLQAIYEDYDREDIRGAQPRYWEEVTVGEELRPVVKGPLSLRDLLAWLMGAGSPFMRAHGLAIGFQRRHPGAAMVDPATGAMDVPELVHMEETRAQAIGLPGAYDYGCQRISWLGHLLTNWMGDDGFLKRFRAELRRFNMLGDTTWCRGKVIGKRQEGGEALVDIECWGENQRGEVTVTGQATVVVPRRP